MVEGNNTIQHDKNVYVEKILTFYSGLCYKIYFDFFTLKNLDFSVIFNNSALTDPLDQPTPEIYLTSGNIHKPRGQLRGEGV